VAPHPRQTTRIHTPDAEILVSGAPASAPTGGSGTARYLAVRIDDVSMAGIVMPVRNANLPLRLRMPDDMMQTVPLARMYAARLGHDDIHYGANLRLPAGRYTARIRVDHHTARLSLRVP
jgi:hypothetical protein